MTRLLGRAYMASWLLGRVYVRTTPHPHADRSAGAGTVDPAVDLCN